MKLRIPHRVAMNLLSSQASYTPESDPEMAATLDRIRDAAVRADFSRQIDVEDPEELATLRVYVEAMEAGAADTTGSGDEGLDGLADLNAARAVLRALSKAEAS